MNIDTTIALLTLEEAKEYVKSSGSTDDSILATLINGISQWVAGFVNRNLILRSYVEYYDGDGSKEILLNNYPVVTINSLYLDSLRAWGADSLVASTNMIIMKSQGIIRAHNLITNWSYGESNLKISYTAGYTAGASGTLPHDIRMAALRILDHQYRTGYTHRKLDVSSESIGERTTTYRDGSIPADAKEMLQPYKKLISVPHFTYAD